VEALYNHGLGVRQNIKIAIQWYEKAAIKKEETALVILGRNEVAKRDITFHYKIIRLRTSKRIPIDYSKRFLRKK